ncbi:MAG: serine/threonine-protein kinase, partial [Planctomycetota bacterium]
MTPQDFERVRELFLAARKLEPAEQSAYLDKTCADNPDLRAEVQALLAHGDGASDGLEMPSQLAGVRSEIERAYQSSESEPLPERIGQYSVLEVLGEGGMGTVYLAEQEHPRRKVALKLVRSGSTSRALLQRLEREASILGQLEHPGIARIYEAGVADVRTKDGLTVRTPFFAMEYVRGRPLRERVEQVGLRTRERLELIASICDAVHHAHQNGVIHRDLKPGNILVDEWNHPKILDFGVARVTDADVQTVTLETAPGQLIGTIAYMSPEQVTGVSANVDTRS